MSRPTEYVCEHCGLQGRDPRPVDVIQCPVCGEPVTPLRGPAGRSEYLRSVEDAPPASTMEP